MHQLLAAPAETDGAKGSSYWNLPLPQALSQVAGGMPHPHDRIDPSPSCESGMIVLVRHNDAMELQQSSALNYGSSVSVAAATDRIIETSIPARLDAFSPVR
jgi:hypothetical protein